MRTKRWETRKGRVLIEYAVLVIVILAALFWMKGPILRAFYGHWKAAGDSFAFGRQYAPGDTVDCARDTASGNWYDQRCFDNDRRACAIGNAACEEGVIGRCTANCNEANEGKY